MSKGYIQMTNDQLENINKSLPLLSKDKRIGLSFGDGNNVTSNTSKQSELIEEALNLGRSQGVINSTNEANYRSLFNADFSSTLSILQDRVTAVDQNKSTSGNQSISLAAAIENLKLNGNLSAERRKWSLNDWRKQDPKALEKLRDEQPKLFEQLSVSPDLCPDRSQWSLTDWRKQDPAGLGVMQQNNPDQFARLVAQG